MNSLFSHKSGIRNIMLFVLLFTYFPLQSSTGVQDSLNTYKNDYIHIENDSNRGTLYILDGASVSGLGDSSNVQLVYIEKRRKKEKSIARKETYRLSKSLPSNEVTERVIAEIVLFPSENNNVFIAKVLQEITVVFPVISSLRTLSTVVFFENTKKIVLKNIKICFLSLDTFYNTQIITYSNFSRPPPQSFKDSKNNLII